MSDMMPAAGAQASAGVEKTVFIRGDLGLHARPAAKLAQTAQQFESQVTLEYEGQTADAKSILDILSLAAGRGASLVLRCDGEDAARAAEAIAEVFSGTET